MAKKIAYAAVLTALAMIFSYVEAMIPVNFGIPGIKLGLANLIVVVGLYFLPVPEVFMILLARVFLVAMLFGNMASLAYSLAGGILSFLVMLCLKKIKGFSIIGISIAGGVAHNIGQITVAILVVQNVKLGFYLPVLMIAGTVTGFLIGLVASKIAPVIIKNFHLNRNFFEQQLDTTNKN